ncbi:Short-chain dehydrogenase/reductase SDR [Penicillium occitanis (nom. inval.)]|nr:Short-chain dehydrogenase/reductase SDR [Penicillium occitanis (nom. inval.)]PCG99132.1 hypothetical protein PENOC_059660 [Penicillium occitanis (nom. inval.)]
MITLPEAIASNGRISSTLPSGLVAVFIGGTSGVGEYTLKAFVKYAVSPRVYLVGRSQESADRIIKECTQVNSGGKFEFIKADISLLKNVDEVCNQLKKRETKINILFETQGTMAFDKKTSEGLNFAIAVCTHSRIRFILNLLPLLRKADHLRRVVSVAAATCEGAIDLNNVTGVGMSLLPWRNQTASIQTLLLEEMAKRAPEVSFVHTVPGVVKSGILRDAQGTGMAIRIAISKLLMPLIATSPAESGERHTFVATSAVYPPGKQGGEAYAGVPLQGNLTTARGTDGKPGSGVYSISNKCEVASPKVEELLATFRKDGTAEKVWDYFSADFKRITGVEVPL